MNPRFTVITTSHFEKEFRKLAGKHPELVGYLTAVSEMLREDPYNHTRQHPIKKLVGVKAGDGQYRIRQGRFRFRYDIEGQTVYLKACRQRSEDAY